MVGGTDLFTDEPTISTLILNQELLQQWQNSQHFLSAFDHQISLGKK
jgi:hypothetical protein